MAATTLKLAFRSLLKRKSVTFIQLSGLILGMGVFLIILQYVAFEKSYDRFNTKSDRIFRITNQFYKDGKPSIEDAMNFAPMGPAMMNELQGIEAFVRLSPEYGKVIFRRDDRIYEEEKVFYCDSSLFTLFDFKLSDGAAAGALAGMDKVVLTKALAEKYFGPRTSWTKSPVGEVINFNNKRNLIVTGILDEVPETCHFKFTALISFRTFLVTNGDPTNNWGWNDFYTYILTTPGTTKADLQSKLKGFVDKHQKNADHTVSVVQPLRDIHLQSHVSYEADSNGDLNSVNAIFAIAIIVLIIAWINYINLATARSEERSKEVGIRKVIGAGRLSLMRQFLSEAFLLNAAAALAAIALAWIITPGMGNLLGKIIPFYLLQDARFWLGFGALLLTGTLLSGLYPAFVLSSFQPLAVMKGSPSPAGKKNVLRKSLVVFQFAIAMILITGTLVIHRQVNFMRSRNLGFDMDRKLIINAPGVYANDSTFAIKHQSFKDELKRNPAVEAVTLSSAIPGKSKYDLDNIGGIRMQGRDERENWVYASYRTDDEFLDTYGIKLLAGKKFAPYRKADDAELIVNEAALEQLGIASPDQAIGQKISAWGGAHEIIGVIENYHHKSLREKVFPVILRNRVNSMLYYTVRIAPANFKDVGRTLEELKTSWNKVYPENPFTWFFLDEHFNDQYKADTQFGKVFTSFSMMAILITCLGLFGLSSYLVIMRTKEIGIRKVLGASPSSIILILSKDYLPLFIIASLLSAPLSWFIFNNWLNDFALRITLSWWMLGIPIALVIVLSLLTVSTHSLKAANADPVDSLRT